MQTRIHPHRPTAPRPARPAPAPAAAKPAAKPAARRDDGETLAPGAKDRDYGQADPGIGQRGAIRRLQADLAALGHFSSPHGYTGGYFAATTDAVKSFQREAGLPVTGRADGRTRTAIANRRSLADATDTARPAEAPAAERPARPARPGAAGADRLKGMSKAELARLGATDKKAFFDALRPAAEEAERVYGVPAEVTLAQAALESGWGKHVPGGDSFNLFGVKGRGPAGGVRESSWESNRSYKKVSTFAKYHDFHEAVMEHGKLFHNGYYTKAMGAVARGNDDPKAFLRNIENVYHGDGRRYTNIAAGMIDRYMA